MNITIDMPVIGYQNMMQGASLIERIREYIVDHHIRGMYVTVAEIVGFVDDLLSESAIDNSFLPIGLSYEIEDWYKELSLMHAPSVTDVLYLAEKVISESIAIAVDSLAYEGKVMRDFALSLAEEDDDFGELVASVGECILEHCPNIISSLVSIVYKTMGLSICYSKNMAVFVDEEDIAVLSDPSIYGEDIMYILGSQVPVFRTRFSDPLPMGETIKYLEREVFRP